jgi:hypothetical protein
MSRLVAPLIWIDVDPWFLEDRTRDLALLTRPDDVTLGIQVIYASRYAFPLLTTLIYLITQEIGK